MIDAPTSPLDGADKRTLTERLLEVESHIGVLGALAGALRTELHRRAVAEWRADRMAPTYRAPGLGTISLPLPQTRVVVADPDEFASWVAQRHPSEVDARIVIDVPAGELAEALDQLERLLDCSGRRVHADVTAREPFAGALLKAATVVDDIAVAASGEVIDGVRVIPGADPAVEDGPVPSSILGEARPAGEGPTPRRRPPPRLPAVLEHGIGLTAVGVVEVYEAGSAVPVVIPVPDGAVEPAEARPPDEDAVRCSCEHFDGFHRGVKRTGGCTAPGCRCSRFKAAPVWAGA